MVTCPNSPIENKIRVETIKDKICEKPMWKANTGFDMESAHPRWETCTRMWNIDMAVQCPYFLVLNSNGWADFLSYPVLPFEKNL